MPKYSQEERDEAKRLLDQGRRDALGCFAILIIFAILTAKLMWR